MISDNYPPPHSFTSYSIPFFHTHHTWENIHNRNKSGWGEKKERGAHVKQYLLTFSINCQQKCTEDVSFFNSSLISAPYFFWSFWNLRPWITHFAERNHMGWMKCTWAILAAFVDFHRVWDINQRSDLSKNKTLAIKMPVLWRSYVGDKASIPIVLADWDLQRYLSASHGLTFKPCLVFFMAITYGILGLQK